MNDQRTTNHIELKLALEAKQLGDEALLQEYLDNRSYKISPAEIIAILQAACDIGCQVVCPIIQAL